MTRRLVPLLLLALAVGCGRDTGIGEQEAAMLAPHVQAVRATSERGDRLAAEQKLAELRATVVSLRDQKRLTEEEADAVLASISEVQAQLALLPLPPPPPAEQPTSGTSRPARQRDGDGENKEEKEEEDGKGEKGKKGEDD